MHLLIIFLFYLFLIIIIAIANLKIHNENKRKTVQYILNFIYLMSFNISVYLVRRLELGNLYVLLKAYVLISSFLFYATDFIKYMKDLKDTKEDSKCDTQACKKIMRKALLNHLVFIGLYLIILYFEYKNI